MRDEFMITRQGKQFVLFAGLLDEAHEKFDRLEIETTIHMLDPKPVILATVRGYAWDEGTGEMVLRCKTSGIGTTGRDSDRKGPAVDAPIEMAETRAKARALRDAVNVGATSLEELSDGGEVSQPQKRSQGSQTGNERARTTSQGNASSNVEQLRGGANKTKNDSKKPKNAAQKSQKDLIRALLLQWQQDSGRADAYLGKILENLEVDSLDHITKPQAEEIIEWVNSKLPDDDEPEDEVEDFDEDEVEEG